MDLRAEIVPIDSILVEDRIRAHIGDLAPIRESAESYMGQIQSIAVEEIPDPVEGKQYRLLGGGRRILAFGEVGMDQVLVRIYPPGLSDIQRKEIELTENEARLQLTWQERVRLETKIHELKMAQHGGETSTAHDPEKGWSLNKTAKALGRSPGGLSENLQLGRLLEVMPELERCKKQSEAEALIKRAVLDIKKADRVQEFETSATLPERKQHLADGYQVGDAFDLIKEIPPASIDFIDLDPPYAIDYENKIVSGIDDRPNETVVMDRANFIDWEKDEYFDLFLKMVKECRRVLKPTGWMTVWFSAQPDLALETYQALNAAGFRVKSIPAIWAKNPRPNVNSNRALPPQSALASDYEPFYTARGGPQANVVRQSRSNVFTYSKPSTDNRIHPTEKPVELMRDILTTLVLPNSTILVPFCGSGNTLLAGYLEKMTGTGYELTDAYLNGFKDRLFDLED